MSLFDMAVIDHVNWGDLDRLVQLQQRNREAHAPVVSLFRWWARRPHSLAGALLDAASCEFGNNSFLVADPFSGGGTVAFEAARRGLPIYAQDLYLWPSQGLATALTSANLRDFENAATLLLARLELYRHLYWNVVEGEVKELTHILRVRTTTCPDCTGRIFLFKEPLISLASRRLGETFGFFGCSACGTVSRRKHTASSFRCDGCGERWKVVTEQSQSASSTSTCRHCCARLTHSEILNIGLEWFPVLVQETAVSLSRSTVRLRQPILGDPVNDLPRPKHGLLHVTIPEGLETGHLLRSGFRFWEDLYTERQLRVIFAALREIDALDFAEPVRARLRLAVLGATEMAGYICRWERYHPKALEAMANHRYSRSMLAVETNLLARTGRGTLPRRFEAAEKALRWMHTKGFPTRTSHTSSTERRRQFSQGALVVTGSSERQLLQDGVVRLVLTDPPYHDDLQYGELSRLFHLWMSATTACGEIHEGDEAAPNRLRGTDTRHYEDKVAACLTESRRTLCHGGRLVLTFHNKNPQAWVALARALSRSAFVIVGLATVASENPADHSKRGKETFLSDLVIECRPRSEFRRVPAKPTVAGKNRGFERRNLIAIGLAIAESVNTKFEANIQDLYHSHLKRMRESHVLIGRGSS